MFKNIQIINQNDKPAFVVIPFEEFQKWTAEKGVTENSSDDKFPLEVAEMHAVKNYSLIKAWRIFKGKTQKEMADALGITQGAFSQIEKSATNQTETLNRVANALGISAELLEL